jgi:hypothetical protein
MESNLLMLKGFLQVVAKSVMTPHRIAMGAHAKKRKRRKSAKTVTIPSAVMFVMRFMKSERNQLVLYQKFLILITI